MDRKTYNALVASVKKWRKNAKAKRPESVKTGAPDCPLCMIFLSEHNCNGCPVFNATGIRECGSTKYRPALMAMMEWDGAVYDGMGNAKECRDKCLSACAEEADFLAALVPAGGPDE